MTDGSHGVWERPHYDWSNPEHVVLTHYNTTRNHSALNDRPPMSGVRDQSRHDSYAVSTPPCLAGARWCVVQSRA